MFDFIATCVRKNCINIASVICFGLMCLPNAVLADKPVPVSVAIDTFKKMSQPYRNLKWTVETQVGTIKAPYKFADHVNDKSKGYVKSYSIVDFTSGKFRFDHETVIPIAAQDYKVANPQQPNPFISGLLGVRLSASFNGKSEREYVVSSMGSDLPSSDQIGEGTISKPTRKQYQKNALANGLAFYPIAMWGDPLCEVMVNSESPISVVDTEDGKWTVKLIDKNGMQAVIVCDLSKGGMIDSIDLGFGQAISKKYQAEYEMQSSGLWVPKVSLFHMVSPGQAMSEMSVYSNVSINTDVNENIFAIHFPAGARVVVEGQDKAYGNREALKGDFEAVKSFIEQEDFQYIFEDVEGSQDELEDVDRSKPFGVRLIAISAISAAFLLAIARWIHRKRKLRLVEK